MHTAQRPENPTRAQDAIVGGHALVRGELDTSLVGSSTGVGVAR